MKKLDFISGTPKISIFREGANKTNLGGTLYLIYLIIFALLATIYIFNYFSQKKYDFNYILVKKSTNDDNFLGKEEEKSMLYTEMEYLFYLGKDGNDYLIENPNFLIIDNRLMFQKLKTVPRGKDGFFNISNDDECIIKQVKPVIKRTNLSLSILYRCEEQNCTIREEDKVKFDSYFLVMVYNGFSIDHQNSEKPILHSPNGDYYEEVIFFNNNSNSVHLNWELIEYEEKKGIFQKTYDDIVGNNYTFYGGYYKSKETYIDDGFASSYPDSIFKIKDLNGNHFKLLLWINSIPNEKEYEKYSRTKISILDALTNVAALSTSALNLMSLVYGFLYSENFDNYKLIETLLTKRMEINIHNNRLSNKDNIDEVEGEKIELKTDLIEGENEKSDMNINGIGDEEKEYENPKGKKEKKTVEKNHKENLDLPKPKFFDFLIHKFYCKSCKSSRRQNLIGSCNDIMAKYVTIENLLYNQMKLECLWKDYKWNNPQNERNQKDNLILDLKEN